MNITAIKGREMTFWQTWKNGEEGVALVEAAMIFPVLFVLLFGIYDIGHAVTVNHKMITATNVVSDVVTRTYSISSDGLDQAVVAGKMAMAPYVARADDLPIYIAAVRFDEDGDPVVLWERAFGGMEPDEQAVSRSRGLGLPGDGVVVVSMIHDYRPAFGGVVIDSFRMREVTYARGRRSSVVELE